MLISGLSAPDHAIYFWPLAANPPVKTSATGRDTQPGTARWGQGRDHPPLAGTRERVPAKPAWRRGRSRRRSFQGGLGPGRGSPPVFQWKACAPGALEAYFRRPKNASGSFPWDREADLSVESPMNPWKHCIACRSIFSSRRSYGLPRLAAAGRGQGRGRIERAGTGGGRVRSHSHRGDWQ